MMIFGQMRTNTLHIALNPFSSAGRSVPALWTAQLPEVVESSATAATAATAVSDESLASGLAKKEIAAPCEGGVVC